MALGVSGAGESPGGGHAPHEGVPGAELPHQPQEPGRAHAGERASEQPLRRPPSKRIQKSRCSLYI
eukprot:1183425-Prorocentrum_minimum.AAC.2